jgi:hypothetical protein
MSEAGSGTMIADQTLSRHEKHEDPEKGDKFPESLNEDLAPKVVPTSPKPDGGVEGWLTLLGAALTQFSTFGYVRALSCLRFPAIMMRG